MWRVELGIDRRRRRWPGKCSGDADGIGGDGGESAGEPELERERDCDVVSRETRDDYGWAVYDIVESGYDELHGLRTDKRHGVLLRGVGG